VGVKGAAEVAISEKHHCGVREERRWIEKRQGANTMKRFQNLLK
jgi:hypothetical protein